ncbi:MAG: hypothetical protein O3C51_05340 [Planctomycetota bacterium]|nr:hypothetical protein [Planctomycetota bacterium]
MSAEANGILRGLRWVERDPEVPIDGCGLLTGTAEAPGGRAFGATITDHRSSWVRRGTWLGRHCYFKTYDYPTRSDRTRGLLRTTAFARSRAQREWDALRWLGARGFAVAAPLALAEARVGPFLRRAVLVTRDFGGPDLRSWLAASDGPERTEVLEALASFITALHSAGFHDRNLDPRNLLARREADGTLVITKIDSPRFVLAPPGSRRARRLEAEDMARLQRGLRELDAELG